MANVPAGSYMGFSEAQEYIKINGLTHIGYRGTDVIQVNGKSWLPTSVISSHLTPEQFRRMECVVTTWVVGLVTI